MQNYELLYIVDFDTNPSESLNHYIDKITKNGGKTFNVGYYSGDNLSDDDRKVMEGPYINIKFSADNSFIKKLKYDLTHDYNVIRHIIINRNQDDTNNNQMPKCPFCGGEFHLLLCDEEGNPHDDDYLNNPYSGVTYCIAHSLKDIPNGVHCPIATSYDDGAISEYLYDTKEEALEVLKIRSN